MRAVRDIELDIWNVIALHSPFLLTEFESRIAGENIKEKISRDSVNFEM